MGSIQSISLVGIDCKILFELSLTKNNKKSKLGL
jgi:hypothetical protein